MKYLSFVSPKDVETQKFDWGTFQWMNTPKTTGTSNMCLGLGHIYPGKGHERHNHPEGEEFIFIVEGSCRQTLEVDGANFSRTLQKGEMVFVPKGAYHSSFNDGKDELVLLACYQFAGPEEFLGSLAMEIIPPKNA